MLDFEKFVMLTEKYAPSFLFLNSKKFLFASDCDYAVARYVYYDIDDSEEPDSEDCDYNNSSETIDPGYVDIAYDFVFDEKTGAIYPVNLRGTKLKNWDIYDELYDEESIAVRLQRLERRYQECIKKRDEFKADMEQEELEEEAKKYDLPLISW